MSITSIEDDAQVLKNYIKSYPDFPQPGILFRWVYLNFCSIYNEISFKIFICAVKCAFLQQNLSNNIIIKMWFSYVYISFCQWTYLCTNCSSSSTLKQNNAPKKYNIIPKYNKLMVLLHNIIFVFVSIRKTLVHLWTRSYLRCNVCTCVKTFVSMRRYNSMPNV